MFQPVSYAPSCTRLRVIGLFAAFFTMMLVASVVAAAEAVQKQDGWIDVRNASSMERTVLAVVARKSENPTGLPGHAVLVLGGESEEEQMCYEDLYGLHPKLVVNGVLSYFIGNVDGEIKAIEEDHNADLVRHRVFIELTTEQRDAIRAFIKKKGERTEYQLGSNDCVTFIEKLLNHLNTKIPIKSERLTVPSRANNETPDEYVERFIMSNAKRISGTRPE